MIIITARFGELELDESKILHLPSGIMGFPDFKRAFIIDHKPNSPFRWLQSVDQADLAFVIIDPIALVPDYPLDRLKKILGETVPETGEIATAAITTVPPAPTPITVNLVAPIVFDMEKRTGAQIILHDARFTTRHILVQEPEQGDQVSPVEPEPVEQTP